jgi:hypothetical protein
MAAPETVDAYLAALPTLRGRRLAHGEWGITIPAENAGGEPLDVGLRLADGLLRAQAVALHGAGDLDPWMLLCWRGDPCGAPRAVTARRGWSASAARAHATSGSTPTCRRPASTNARWTACWDSWRRPR